MSESKIRGSLPEIIRNDHSLYTGDLEHYFRVLFNHAQNLNHPYHNFRHMTHVLWLCYDACEFYKDDLDKIQMRHLLIGAIFHDFDHFGSFGNDDLNIERALRGLRTHILPQDASYLADVETIIRPTEYPPPKGSRDNLTLCGQIICDADVSQGLSTAWIQHVVFGLAKEWGKPPIEVLRMQKPFLGNLRFLTNWAKERFPRYDIDAKVAEAEEICALLDG